MLKPATKLHIYYYITKHFPLFSLFFIKFCPRTLIGLGKNFRNTAKHLHLQPVLDNCFFLQI